MPETKTPASCAAASFQELAGGMLCSDSDSDIDDVSDRPHPAADRPTSSLLVTADHPMGAKTPPSAHAGKGPHFGGSTAESNCQLEGESSVLKRDHRDGQMVHIGPRAGPPAAAAAKVGGLRDAE